jgi:hypothetical protein
MKNVYTNFYTATPSIVTMKQAYFVDKVGEVDLQYYVQKAASTIYTSGWDAATFIAEITQQLRMLSRVGKKLANLSQGRKPGELFDLWLEGSYGWRTLMYDIRDLQPALSAAKDRRTRYRQTCGFTTTGNWNESYMSGSDIVDEISNDISWTINMRGTVVADIDVPTFQFNPVTTAWEVTKLSFVIDWLLNVGQALEAASFLLAVKDYKACGGYKIDFNLTGSRVHVSHESYLSNVTSDGTWNATATAICRVPMTVSASPHMKLRLDGYKVIDLLALIAQRLR